MGKSNDRKQSDVDVVLFYPRTGLDLGSTVAPPYALLTIAAPLHNAGIKVRIIDQRVDRHWAAHLREALECKPICCGISVMTGTQIRFGIESAKLMREETGGNVPLVWGGCHPTILPEQTLRSDYVDIVCVGEGDISFPNLVHALSRKEPISKVSGFAYLDGDSYAFSGEAPLIDIEVVLPTPWELVDADDYIHPDLYLRESRRVLDLGQTSRGCPYRCAFCCSAAIRKNKWRGMSVEKSLGMIVNDVRRFNLDGIWLRDDEFYVDQKRATEICEGIIREELNIAWYTSGTRISDLLRATDEQLEILKCSGAYVVKMGAESGSDRILEYINKKQTVNQILEANRRCMKFGIKPAFSLMCGFPTETLEEINKTIDLFFRIQKENPTASVETIAQFTALPGTPLYDIAIEMGLQPPQRFEEWSNWLFHDTDIKGERLPWFEKRERKAIGNLNYLSILSKTGVDIASTMRNKLLSKVVYALALPFSKYFSWRLKRKSYYFVPEIKPIKMFQSYMFSSSNIFTSENIEDKNTKPRYGLKIFKNQ